MEEKITRLVTYCQALFHGENGRELYDLYKDDIQSVTPEEVVQVMERQLSDKIVPKDMLGIVDKCIHVFYESLSKFSLYHSDDLFTNMMLQENQGLEQVLNDFKVWIKAPDTLDSKKVEDLLNDIQPYMVHIEKLENIVFPMLEKEADYFDGLKIMWSLHDEVRQFLKEMKADLPNYSISKIGELYFYLFGLLKKQQLILLPLVKEKLTEDQLLDMYDDSFEFGFAYMIPTVRKKSSISIATKMDSLISTDTGTLELEMLITIMNHLPVDFTYVNEKDEVAYFNDSKERVFPRAKSIIGRNVRNCHPPESVHIVEDIIQGFKDKSHEKAEFWLTLHGRKIYIYYIPLRDKNGLYKGVLEISQDVTYVSDLKGNSVS